MAIDLYSESSGVSPRISFSHDLCVPDTVPVEHHPLQPGSLGSIDFDFCVRKSFGQDSSSADELFSDGKILPTEIKTKITVPAPKQMDRSIIPPGHDDVAAIRDDGLKKDYCSNDMKSPGYEAEEKQSSKSFWRFKRSSSVNCANRSLCPLPLLSRSYSTGSTPSSKRASLAKDTNHKQNKQPFFKSSSQSFSSTNYQKPPLKKNFGPAAYGNAVRVTPVLNVPSGNLFGLGSIFFNGKDKNKKK